MAAKNLHPISLISLFILLCFPLPAYSSHAYQQIKLPPGMTGPESVAFDCKGKGPYTGVSDGRIFKYEGRKRGWRVFGFTSPLRNSSLCDGSTDPDLGPTCGRPLGLQFNKRTCELYVADAYYGLLKVGRNGGKAIHLASSAEGIPFKFTNSLDVDNIHHVIYFTDSSSRFQQREFWQIYQTDDKTGRFMKYDLRTKQVTVLLKGLMLANGVAISKEKDYVIVSEYRKGEILRYWLQGHKANTWEFFARPPGPPDNINRNAKGDFWVGLSITNKTAGEIIGVLLDRNGQILRRLPNDGVIGSASEVEERNGFLWLGSVGTNYVGVTRV
ncbi:hypothetical protein ACHQM5_001043 [Ranunculus cassubicifolius]